MLYTKHYSHHLVKRFVRLYNVRRLERKTKKQQKSSGKIALADSCFRVERTYNNIIMVVSRSLS